MKIICRKSGFEIENEVNSSFGFKYKVVDGIEIFKEGNDAPSEEITRDRQAGNYLQHVKVKSQSIFIDEFLKTISNPSLSELKVLDLGVGPGPTVSLLLKNKFKHITAIDFSHESLLINRHETANVGDVRWISADLMAIKARPNSFDVLIMSDFIQHIGTFEDKITLLNESIEALKSGGSFFLSFFNFNLINYIKGDLRGSFSEGSIKYERLIPSEIVRIISDRIKVTKIYPMNITHNYKIDKFLNAIPGSRLLATMYAIEGIRI